MANTLLLHDKDFYDDMGHANTQASTEVLFDERLTCCHRQYQGDQDHHALHPFTHTLLNAEDVTWIPQVHAMTDQEVQKWMKDYSKGAGNSETTNVSICCPGDIFRLTITGGIKLQSFGSSSMTHTLEHMTLCCPGQVTTDETKCCLYGTASGDANTCQDFPNVTNLAHLLTIDVKKADGSKAAACVDITDDLEIDGYKGRGNCCRFSEGAFLAADNRCLPKKFSVLAEGDTSSPSCVKEDDLPLVDGEKDYSDVYSCPRGLDGDCNVNYPRPSSGSMDAYEADAAICAAGNDSANCLAKTGVSTGNACVWAATPNGWFPTTVTL